MSLMETIKKHVREVMTEINKELIYVKLQVKMDKGYEHLLPMKAHPSDAGYDLRAAIDTPVVISPGECKIVPVGFSCALPEGYEMQIRPRSGLAIKNYISVLNTPGTIDCNYRGPVGVILYNFGKYEYTVEPYDKIAQGVVCKLPKTIVVPVDELSDTDRGSGGFGSTGKA